MSNEYMNIIRKNIFTVLLSYAFEIG